MRKIIAIENGVARHPLWRMKEPVNLEILEGEQVAIVGNNAAGKTRLVELITQHYPLLLNEVKYDFGDSPLKLVSDNLKYITFRDSYGEGDATYYYQKRWNQHDIEDDAPMVGTLLEETFKRVDDSFRQKLEPAAFDAVFSRFRDIRERIAALFRIDGMREKYLLSLSSGEMRKFQLAKALGSAPSVLIIDNPFVGLDFKTRDQLRLLLSELSNEIGLHIILILNQIDTIPEFITHVLPVEGLKLKKKMIREEFLAEYPLPSVHLPSKKRDKILNLPPRHEVDSAFYQKSKGEILKFNKVSIRYGNHTIMENVDWTVLEGERWALSGDNGAGKSTLLSLVCADNPQAYACGIELFGHKRGNGESIWEIKKHIGYVSPEMHRSYQKDIPCMEIVASGLTDSVGLYVKPKASQKEICAFWMDIFNISHLADVSFLKVSSGEQRLCLLARAFVKDPELLILDEPLHGLDTKNRALTKEIIETFCQRKHKTLVMVTHYAEELPPCINRRKHLVKKKHPTT